MNTDNLLRHAQAQGIFVAWDRRLLDDGRWIQRLNLIAIRDGMTERRTRSTLAHELGHAHYGDRCSNPKAERRAWEYAAHLLINPERFDEVVELHGPHAGAIARHLDVLVDVVRAYWRIHPRRKP